MISRDLIDIAFSSIKQIIEDEINGQKKEEENHTNISCNWEYRL